MAKTRQMGLGCLLVGAVAYLSVVAGDRFFPEVPSRISFGSCAKQRKKEESDRIWKAVAATKPEAWIWMGDAIYPPKEPARKEVLAKAYADQMSNKAYANFVKEVAIVDGVIDDHDSGLNDGGKNWEYKDEAKHAFLDFLGVPADSVRRSRDGTYVSHVYGSPPHQIKLIMLDTRYNRDDPPYPKIGEWKFFGSSVFAAAVRCIYTFLGIGASHDGDMLGETQWKWLEQQLNASEANAHAIVSSVQVTTSFSCVESWGQFPMAQRRLFDLVQKTKPQGVFFLSGDVHFAQILGQDEAVVEITSSGLTHTVAEYTGFWQFAENFLMPDKTRFFGGYNFGLLDISFKDADNGVVETNVAARVLSDAGEEKLRADLHFRSDEDPTVRLNSLNEVPPAIPRRSLPSKVLRWGIIVLIIAWALQVQYLIISHCLVAFRSPSVDPQYEAVPEDEPSAREEKKSN